MDYTNQPLSFKIKKAARYVRMYGPLRTLAKIRGQFHMKKTYEVLPGPTKRLALRDQHVGLIGCGNFAFSCIAYYLKKNYGATLRGVMDIDVNRAASLYERYKAGYYTDNSARIIQDPHIDLVFIASNHASHADYAVRALDAGKSVHIEKPPVVTSAQLVGLCNAMIRSTGRVALGFNRPSSTFGRQISESLGRETGTGMYNWFVAGHALEPDHWYLKEEEGGRVLGNLCHWTDFVYHLVPGANRHPITIIPTRYEESNTDIVVTYLFGEGSIATISFTEQILAFEGVKERFAGHKGNALVVMDDFKTLTVEVGHVKKVSRPLFRDHGHEQAIKRSYGLARGQAKGSSEESVRYVWETSQLFLQTKEALEQRSQVTVDAFDPSLLSI